MLGAVVEPNCTGLRELSLNIQGQLTEGGLKLLDTEAEWVKMGLRSFKFLHHFELIIASDTIHMGAAANFECRLLGSLGSTDIMIKALVWGSEIIL